MNTDEAVHRLPEVIRRKHLAIATKRSYCAWLRRYCDCFKGLPSHCRVTKSWNVFTLLAKKGVTVSIQNQACNAIIFFYEEAAVRLTDSISFLKGRQRKPGRPKKRKPDPGRPLTTAVGSG
jgi:hypothetical protein